MVKKASKSLKSNANPEKKTKSKKRVRGSKSQPSQKKKVINFVSGNKNKLRELNDIFN